ncbi:MAG: hypothetical protein LDL06_04380, partial [Candidatus Nitrosotenuis sp.]|nr:hypothetical protein [Candidatus Nitrosotenuis sp.]
METFQQLGCIEKHHQIITVTSDEELNMTRDKNDKFVFTNHVNTHTERKEILNHKIRSLRPISYFPDKNFKAILVYLPTKKETIKGEGDKQKIEKEFLNSAFFVISKPKNTIGPERIVVPFDDPFLTEHYKITVMPEWDNVRWEESDLKSWLDETEKTDPTIVYNLHDTVTKRYLEFDNEAQYVKFNLWNIGTYLFELFNSYPINDFTGTKEAGKSKSLLFQTLVCYNGFMSGSMSASALFRLREGTGGFIAIDETEQFKNLKNENAQETRTLLLQSFLKNQYAIRVEGKLSGGFTVSPFNLYGPTSLAHINAFDDVLEDRCIPQINKRAVSSEIKDTWPTYEDTDFQKIRNLCYRLFLDYADEIYKLQSEARKLLPISGRELQLWTPIITLAVFFENKGIPGLIEQSKALALQTRKERQLLNEQESNDLKVLNFLDVVGVKLGEDPDQRKENPSGWIPSKVLYENLIVREEYGFNKEWFYLKGLTQIIRRLGFTSEKKVAGVSWHITREKVDEIKKRWGLD